MSAVELFAAGGYRYIPAVFQYSSGVAAEPGYLLERARFVEPLPLAEAFVAVERHLDAIGRPLTAFAACELRSPAPFTEQGFRDFNKAYVVTLERWGIGYADCLHKRFPRLIHCRVSGFGADGPLGHIAPPSDHPGAPPAVPPARRLPPGTGPASADNPVAAFGCARCRALLRDGADS